jgi:hypothetical protein
MRSNLNLLGLFPDRPRPVYTLDRGNVQSPPKMKATTRINIVEERYGKSCWETDS